MRTIATKAFQDATITPEISLVEGMFFLLNDYFKMKDFEEINMRYIT